MKVHRENIIIGLANGITKIQEINEKSGYTGESAFITGLREVLQSLIDGEDLEFYKED